MPQTKRGERQLRAYETKTLGAEHAREHALQRRVRRKQIRRWRRMTPAARRRQVAASQEQDMRIVAASASTGDANQVGRWTTAPFPIPNYAIHAVMLPTGKVLFWGYPPFPAGGGARPNEGRVALWEPWKGTGPNAFEELTPPLVDTDGDGDTEPAPIYCSGQSFLPSGEVVLAGGNLVWPGQGNDYQQFAGDKRVFTFDPWSETWTEQPQMAHGRWYPSQVELADGRTLIASGYSDEEPGGLYNRDVEMFTPGPAVSSPGTVERVPSTDQGISLYPGLFTLPNEDVLLAGPDRADSAVLDTETWVWQDLPWPSRDRTNGAQVLVPGGPQGSYKALQFGGYDLDVEPDLPGMWQAANTAESIDVSQPSPSWNLEPSLNVARANQNAVLLPDGSMVTIGGGSGYSDELGGYETYSDGRARQVELWDPQTGTWRLGPAQQEDRAYHSTTALLPDGRVLSAGDDYHPEVNGTYNTSDTAEVYSPPYLFKGPRPEIRAAPAVAGWGDEFGIRSRSPDLTRAVLVAPAATTHGADMQQRHVELEVAGTIAGQGLNVVAPPSPGVAPPGYYMLFLLNAQGVPSVARWIRLDPSAPDQAEIVIEPRFDLSDASPTAANPQVGVDSEGDAVFAWVHFDGNNDRVQTRERSAAGVLGPVQDVSPAGANASSPGVAVDSNGDAVLSWLRFDGANQRLQARGRSAAGVLSPVQDISRAAEDAFAPQVSVDSDGDAVFAWLRHDGTHLRVQARGRSAAGARSAIQNVSHARHDASSPRVAMDPDGDALVVWLRPDGTSDRVYARARAAAGSLGSIETVSGGGQSASEPQLALDSDGDALLTWLRSDGSNQRVEARGRSAVGAWRGVQTISKAGLGASSPEVAVDADGDAVLTWLRSDGTSLRVQARGRSAVGILSPVQDISSGAGLSSPRVAVDPDGDAVLAWTRQYSGLDRVQARARSAEGNRGAVQTLSDPGMGALSPQVAVNPDGMAVFAWARLEGSSFRAQGTIWP